MRLRAEIVPNEQRRVRVHVGSLQVDNQHPSTHFPVVLQRPRGTDDGQPVLAANVEHIPHPANEYFKSVVIILKPLQLRIDSWLLAAFLGMARSSLSIERASDGV